MIQTVTTRLTGGSYNSPNLLGKLYPATDITYNTEANAAVATLSSSTTPLNGDYWFWYVAPDDFTESINSSDVNQSERVVMVHVTTTYVDGTSDDLELPIKIVRPPLLLVHGLAGDPTTWDHFTFNNGTLFKNSFLWKQKHVLELFKHAYFADNANYILSPDNTNYHIPEHRLNTLQGNIEALRSQGYACNQVDYVCHSMGGCVLRTAATFFSNKFFGEGGSPYKNYGKGFIHKIVTLNTPHGGSPVADAITEFIPEAPTYINFFLNSVYKIAGNKTPLIGDFIEPIQPGNLFSEWKSTDAVRDLQVSGDAGGETLLETKVKYHLIAGDIDGPSSNAWAELDKYLELVEQVFKVMRSFAQGPAKTYLTGLLLLDKATRSVAFLDWYSQQKGYPDFFADGDMIVPLKSQLAGLAANSSTVSVFHNTNMWKNARHTSIQKRDDVGTRVFDLLNQPITST
ncbi:MAG: hypothetical protein EOP48_24775, partial [Sphingobacteriales bacterium]